MASEAQIAADIGAAGSCGSRLRGHELHAGGLVLAACVRARRVHACVRTCHAWAGGLACSRFLLWRFRSIWTVPAPLQPAVPIGLTPWLGVQAAGSMTRTCAKVALPRSRLPDCVPWVECSVRSVLGVRRSVGLLWPAAFLTGQHISDGHYSARLQMLDAGAVWPHRNGHWLAKPLSALSALSPCWPQSDCCCGLCSGRERRDSVGRDAALRGLRALAHPNAQGPRGDAVACDWLPHGAVTPVHCSADLCRERPRRVRRRAACVSASAGLAPAAPRVGDRLRSVLRRLAHRASAPSRVSHGESMVEESNAFGVGGVLDCAGALNLGQELMKFLLPGRYVCIEPNNWQALGRPCKLVVCSVRRAGFRCVRSADQGFEPHQGRSGAGALPRPARGQLAGRAQWQGRATAVSVCSWPSRVRSS